jgi:hypothetical protein
MTTTIGACAHHDARCGAIAPSPVDRAASQHDRGGHALGVVQKLRCYNGRMTTMISCDQLSDSALLDEVRRRASAERQCTAALVAALMELDTRRLYLGQGCASLFTYCTQVLHLSEHAAYGRIAAARATGRFPQMLALLADGSITLTTVCLLAPVLTEENHREVLSATRHKSRREVEQIVASLRPQPATPAAVRKLPTPHRTTPALPPGAEAQAPPSVTTTELPSRGPRRDQRK